MLQPVDQGLIEQLLSDTIRKQITCLEVLPIIDSTNTYLLDLAKQGAPSGAICFAHSQTAGRGRRGRLWLSPPGSNIYCSFLQHLSNNKMGLSLVVGIAIARVLTRFSVKGIGLKWPNDIYCQQKKLGGILIELGQLQQTQYAVIGIGINVNLSPETIANIDQPCIDLQTALAPLATDTNQLAAELISELLTVLAQFNLHGLAPFLAEWHTYDILQGKLVTVMQSSEKLQGIASGVDEQGVLQLLVNGETQKIIGGEVSVRLLG